MGVSRLDTFAFSTIIADGNPPAPNASYIGPVNGFVAMSVSGSLGGGTITAEITHDNGATWQTHTGLNLAGSNTAATLQVVANGIRPKMTGSTSPAAAVKIALIQY
jgi:hypothetical protein